MFEVSLKLLDLGYFEVKFAFEGLSAEHVWERPAPQLLSVGELAGHIAYWEAVRLAGEGDDLSKCRIKSRLVDERFRYYSTSIGTTPTDEHLAMNAKQVYEELLRVHDEAIAVLRELNHDPAAKIPGCPADFTYGEYLEYAVFHIAYHTGQMFSVRHLLGEETPDN